MSTKDATVKPSKKTKKFKRIYLVAYGDVSKHKKKDQRKRLITLTSVWMVYFYAWFLFSRFFTYHIFWNKSLFFRFIGGGRFSPMSTIIVIIHYLNTYIFSDYTSSIDIKEQLFYLEFILIDTVLTSVLNFSHVPYLPTYLL